MAHSDWRISGSHWHPCGDPDSCARPGEHYCFGCAGSRARDDDAKLSLYLERWPNLYVTKPTPKAR